MRNTKKVISILLTLLMVVGMMSTFAFAEGDTNPGSITIKNPQEGASYTAYKIFDVVYDTTKTNYNYTIDTNNAFYSVVEKQTGLTLQNIAGVTNKKTVTFDKATFNAADFAKNLKTEFEKSDFTKPTGVAAKNNKIENLPLGYYFVTTATADAVCNLTTTKPDAEIYDKNTNPDPDKTVNQVSVDIGQTVTYTLSGNVVVGTQDDTYKFNLIDKISKGLDYVTDSTTGKVKITKAWLSKTGETDVDISADAYTVSDIDSVNGDDATNYSKTFTITFKPDVLKQYANLYKGYRINVSYQATVNKDAAFINENEYTLEYKQGAKEDSGKDTANVYVGKIIINKYDSADTTKKLEGATFVLYKNIEVGTEKIAKYYKLDNNNVTWVDSLADATPVTTTDHGVAEFAGLAIGTYYLHETVAPEGYNVLTSDVEIKIGEDVNSNTEISSANKSAIESKLSVTQGVANSTGTELPSTGGIGTTIFYLIGAILVIGAGVVFVTRRRMHSEK